MIKYFALINKLLISDVLMAVAMKATTVVWDVTRCGLPVIYQHLRQPTGAAN